MAENLVYVYSKSFGVNASCVRIFNSFGPGLSENDSRILSRIASAVVANQSIKIFSNKTLPTRTYCPSGNTIAGIFLALLKGAPAEIYNIGIDSPEITVPQLVETIEHSCGIRIKFTLAEPEFVYHDEPLRRCPDISKARQSLGFSPKISLEEGLKLFFDWALVSYCGKNT
jgi:UDP-glucuronate decarboxylase